MRHSWPFQRGSTVFELWFRYGKFWSNVSFTSKQRKITYNIKMVPVNTNHGDKCETKMCHKCQEEKEEQNIFLRVQKQVSKLVNHQMKTFSALLAICAGNAQVTGEFPAERPVTRSFDCFFDLRLNKRLSKQSRSWWFETQSRPLWRHSDDVIRYHLLIWFVLAFWSFQNYSGTITACGQIFTISALRTAVLMLWAVVSSLIET